MNRKLAMGIIFIFSALIVYSIVSFVISEVPREFGTLELNLQKAGSIRFEPEKFATSKNNLPLEATNVRVLIFNEQRKVKKDYPIPEDQSELEFEIKVPVGEYALHVITYQRQSGVVITAGVEDIVVSKDEKVTPELVIDRFYYELEKPEGPVLQGDDFPINVTVDTKGIKMALLEFKRFYRNYEESANNRGTGVLVKNFKPVIIYANINASEHSKIMFCYRHYLDRIYNLKGCENNLAVFYPSLVYGDEIAAIEVIPR